MMFFYIETFPRARDRQRSTKIEGKTYTIVHYFYFGKICLSMWSLNLCLSVGNSPEAMVHMGLDVFFH